MAVERVDQLRATVTEHVEGIRRHLEERLDRITREVEELRSVTEDIDRRVRYLEEVE